MLYEPYDKKKKLLTKIKIIVFITFFFIGAYVTWWKITCAKAYQDYTGITANSELVNKMVKDK